MHVLKFQNSVEIKGKPLTLISITHLQALANALQLNDLMANAVDFFHRAKRPKPLFLVSIAPLQIDL
jgi:hypothetical protein